MLSQARLHADVQGIQTTLATFGYYAGSIDGDFGGASKRSLNTMGEHANRYRLSINPGTSLTPPGTAPAQPSRIFTEADYQLAAVRIKAAGQSARPLNELVAAIKAFKEVESGTGWFTSDKDVARINALDGDGGWLDGTDLTKILFEAKWFDNFTGGKFRTSHPNLSSRTWNRALYVGGVAEWERLWKAMQLDRTAALMSASVGTFQIMGFNFQKAGFPNVQDFWDAHMGGGAAAHMAAFVSFIINTKGLAAKVCLIDGKPKNAEPAAETYNGSGFRANDYHTKIAKAYIKHLG